MNNADDILKKILLNMRYDSSKTLKENKLLLEEDKKYALAWDGRTLELPLNAVINSYHNMSNFNLKPISDLEILFPLWSESCKIYRIKDDATEDVVKIRYDKCMNDYKTKWTSNVRDGSVSTFTIDGKKYVQCYGVHVKKNGSNVLGTVEDMTFHGYGSPCKDRQFWTAYSKEVPKKTTESPKTDSNLNKELINKAGTENSYDGKELITFDLDL